MIVEDGRTTRSQRLFLKNQVPDQNCKKIQAQVRGSQEAHQKLPEDYLSQHHLRLSSAQAHFLTLKKIQATAGMISHAPTGAKGQDLASAHILTKSQKLQILQAAAGMISQAPTVTGAKGQAIPQKILKFNSEVDLTWAPIESPALTWAPSGSTALIAAMRHGHGALQHAISGCLKIRSGPLPWVVRYSLYRHWRQTRRARW